MKLHMLWVIVVTGTAACSAPAAPAVLETETFRHYVEQFNKDDEELHRNVYPNAEAWDFLEHNIPMLDCPDEDIQRTYYFRWWTYRKHIKKTPAGFIVDEFLPPVSWAGKYNAIPCPAGHHFYEGRWLRNCGILDDYARFWFRGGGNPHAYSFWAADAIWARSLVNGDTGVAVDLLPDLIRNYEAWEKAKRDPSGLFWQVDDRDGMEVSIGGSGYRATINSYQFGDAVAISRIATLAGQKDVARDFMEKAEQIKELVQTRLWDKDAQFFKVLPRGGNSKLVDVRELHGFTPWYFNLPDTGKGYEVAWKDGTWDAGKGGVERGKDYNHSTYCDLIISGLVGLRPRMDATVEVNPLLPRSWDFCCLDQIPYHGHLLTILWDKTGEKYHKGKGLRVLADGREIAGSEKLGRITGTLPEISQ
ncbi:MAG: glycosyl hydrolase family 65 protein [Verrucomicrobiota bacterium]